MSGARSTILAALSFVPGGETFDPPVRLQADGACIDTGKEIAHAGPQMHDLDRDGKLDLVVGNFRGHFQTYRNTGSSQVPAFQSLGMLEAADGKKIEVHNW
jgi:hypothetical protein